MDLAHPFRAISPGAEGDVLGVLARGTSRLTGREIGRMVPDRSHGAVQRALQRLTEQGLVTRSPAGRAFLYSLNRDHVLAGAVEQIAHARLRLIGQLRDQIATWQPNPLSAVWFGSGGRGTAGPTSDIDILLVRPSDTDDEIWARQTATLEALAAGWTGNRVEVLDLSLEQLGGAGGLEEVVAEAMRDGIHLAGKPLRKIAGASA